MGTSTKVWLIGLVLAPLTMVTAVYACDPYENVYIHFFDRLCSIEHEDVQAMYSAARRLILRACQDFELVRSKYRLSHKCDDDLLATHWSISCGALAQVSSTPFEERQWITAYVRLCLPASGGSFHEFWTRLCPGLSVLRKLEASFRFPTISTLFNHVCRLPAECGEHRNCEMKHFNKRLCDGLTEIAEKNYLEADYWSRITTALCPHPFRHRNHGEESSRTVRDQEELEDNVPLSELYSFF